MDQIREYLDQVRQYGLNHEFLGMDVWRVWAGIGVFIVIYLFRRLLVTLLMALLGKFANWTKTRWDNQVLDAVKPPVGAGLQLLNVYAAVAILQLPREPVDARGVADWCISTGAIAIVAWALIRSVKVLSAVLTQLTSKTSSPLDDRLVPFLEKFLRIVLVLLAALMVLQQTGVQIAGILAGLGLGGLAIALAAKDMLANIFGSITIVADHPFEVGDWIKSKDVEGTVEDIGFRSTKVRTFANSQVNVPNAALVNSAVENFSRMQKRRITYRIDVTYETTPTQMREALARVRDVLRNNPEIRQDFWLVYFTDFAASSMQIMIYCFSHTTVWAEYLRVREDVNLAIMETLAEVGVEFAFPSTAVYMREDDLKVREDYDAKCAAMLQTRAGGGDSGAQHQRGNEAEADGG